MRICTIRGVELKMNPLLLVVIAGACVLGQLNELLQTLLALTLHEIGHAVTASAFGCRIRSMELQPFGGVARLSESALSPHAEWCVAAAGPVVSFILAGATATAGWLANAAGARMEAFFTFNIMLGAINLLPALPLDGGRIAKCALQSRTGLAAATRITAWTGVGIGTAMLAMTVVLALYGKQNLTLPVMGVFLLIAAIGELRTLPDKQLATVWRHQEALADEGMEVHMVAAHKSMRGMEALRLVQQNRFNVIRVLDEGMRTVGELDEQRLVLGLARLGTGVSVGEILLFDQKNRLC